MNLLAHHCGFVLFSHLHHKPSLLTVVHPDCYVADEIITSRAKVRVRVGNTDAEGRMAMTDLLCRAKEWVSAEKSI